MSSPTRRTGQSVPYIPPWVAVHLVRRIGREDVDESFGPASVVLRGCGAGVGSALGPGSDLLSGLTPFWLSCDRPVARVPVVQAPTGAAGPICLAWARGRGFTDRRPAGAVPSLNHREKGRNDNPRRHTRHHRRRGHPRRHARRGRARLDRGAAGGAGVPGHRGRVRGICSAGCAVSGTSPWPGSRAPAATGPAWPATWLPMASRSSVGTAQPPSTAATPGPAPTSADALAPTLAAVNGEASGVPKSHDGTVEASPSAGRSLPAPSSARTQAAQPAAQPGLLHGARSRCTAQLSGLAPAKPCSRAGQRFARARSSGALEGAQGSPCFGWPGRHRELLSRDRPPRHRS